MDLEHVIRPFGFLTAHDEAGNLAVLLMEIAILVGKHRCSSFQTGPCFIMSSLSFKR